MKSIDVDRAVEVINRQIEAIEAQQKRKGNTSVLDRARLTSQVMTMARGLAALLAEMRKSSDDVEEALNNLTPERKARLALLLVDELSPEYRAAVVLHIQERDGKLIPHAG